MDNRLFPDLEDLNEALVEGRISTSEYNKQARIMVKEAYAVMHDAPKYESKEVSAAEALTVSAVVHKLTK